MDAGTSTCVIDAQLWVARSEATSVATDENVLAYAENSCVKWILFVGRRGREAAWSCACVRGEEGKARLPFESRRRSKAPRCITSDPPTNATRPIEGPYYSRYNSGFVGTAVPMFHGLKRCKFDIENLASLLHQKARKRRRRIRLVHAPLHLHPISISMLRGIGCGFVILHTVLLQASRGVDVSRRVAELRWVRLARGTQGTQPRS